MDTNLIATILSPWSHRSWMLTHRTTLVANEHKGKSHFTTINYINHGHLILQLFHNYLDLRNPHMSNWLYDIWLVDAKLRSHAKEWMLGFVTRVELMLKELVVLHSSYQNKHTGIICGIYIICWDKWKINCLLLKSQKWKKNLHSQTMYALSNFQVHMALPIHYILNN